MTELKFGDAETSVSTYSSVYHPQTGIVVKKLFDLLEWVLWRNEKPQFVKVIILAQVVGQCQMSYVDWIKRASENACS